MSQFDGNKVADAIVNAVVFTVETVVGLVVSLGSLFSGQREKAPRFKIDDKKKKPVTVIAMILITLSLASLFITMRDRPPVMDVSLDLAIGEGMAEETAKFLGNRGQIVVIRRDSQDVKLPGMEAQMNAFQKTLSKKGGIKIVGVETLNMPVAHSRSPSPLAPPMIFSAAMFSMIPEKYPNVSAIVSFVGVPFLTDEEIAGLGQNIPKVIVLTDMHPSLKKLFEEGVVQLAILRHFGTDLKDSKKPRTPRELFNQLYTVVTKETASSALP